MAQLRPRDLGIGQLFERVRDAVVVADATTGRIVLWNPAAEAVFGFTADAVRGQPLEILIPEPLRAAHRAGLVHYQQTGHGEYVDRGTVLELPALHQRGHQITIEMTLSPIGDGSHGGRFVLAVIRDVTERKRAEEAERQLIREQAARAEAEAGRRELARTLEQLRHSEERFRTMFEQSPLSIQLFAPDGFCLAANPAWEELWGVSREHLDGYNILQDPQLAEKGILPDIQAAFAGEARVLSPAMYDPVDTGRGSRRRWVQAFAYPVVSEDGEVSEVALVLQDVTAMQEAIAARDTFLSVAAHELKTPITSIVGSAQLAMRQLDRPDDKLDVAKLRHRLHMVSRQSLRLSRLVTQLLDISRQQTGQLALETVPTDLVSLVTSVVEDAADGREEYRIEVHAPAQLVVTVDPLRFEQVLVNLVDNAMKYSPEGGLVVVELSQPITDRVRISVVDQGVGVGLEHRAYIFDRFYRAGSTERTTGLGLGLYISRQIVELHGGEIHAEHPPSGGARFVVEIPIDGPGPRPLSGSATTSW